MHTITHPNLVIEQQEYNLNNKWRLSKYCIVQRINDYYSIYNSLVGSLILLSTEEYSNICRPKNSNAFVKYWFIVPENFDESDLARKVRQKMTLTEPAKYEHINSFIILPTSACNAHCWYCFQNGQKRSHMSEQTAKDVVDFIVRKATSTTVNIKWFGGEPMFNENIIDTIVMGLLNNGITVRSSMISNGLLFDKNKIVKYKNVWGLSKVQITLDGVGENYNKIKQYGSNINAFDKVTENINTLSSNGIGISIRINYSLDNESDVDDVMEYYNKNWKTAKNISCYIAAVYQERTSPETSKQMLDLADSFHKKYPNNFGYVVETSANLGLRKQHCITDGGGAVIINPDGKLGGCEHYIDSHFFGSIYEDGKYDQDMIRSYMERVDEFEVCKNCSIFPSCHMIKICSDNFCDQYLREFHIKGMKKSIIRKVKKYLKDNINNM